MIRFGLVGYGLWGTYHARAIVESDSTTLVAVACASEATAARARDDLGNVDVVRGYESLTRRPDIDAIAVVAPNHLHADIAVTALLAGKDVLLEKPMATTVGDCDRIIDAARTSGRTVSVVHQFRLSTQWGAVKACITAGDIGEPCYANVSLFRFPYRPGSGGWRNDSALVGSWILEEPVHFYDSVMWYFDGLGDPERVTAIGSPRDAPAGMTPNFSSTLHWPTGAYATITQSLAGFENHQVVEVVGTHGAIRGWWSGVTDRTSQPRFELKVKRRGNAHCEAISTGPSGEVVELARTYENIAAAFQNKRPLVATEEARKRIVVCLAAERALAAGVPQALAF